MYYLLYCYFKIKYMAVPIKLVYNTKGHDN